MLTGSGTAAFIEPEAEARVGASAESIPSSEAEGKEGKEEADAPVTVGSPPPPSPAHEKTPRESLELPSVRREKKREKEANSAKQAKKDKKKLRKKQGTVLAYLFACLTCFLDAPPPAPACAYASVHIPYAQVSAPFRMKLSVCHLCKKEYVPEVLLATCEPPASVRAHTSTTLLLLTRACL